MIPWAIFLALRDSSSQPVISYLILPASLNEDWRYVGCFYYERAKPPLRLVFYNETQQNSIDHCVRLCKWAGLAFAGLAEGSLCYCDRQLPVFMLPSPQCGSISCPADPSKETCGGKNAIAVYATGIPDDFVPFAPTLCRESHFHSTLFKSFK